MNLIEIKNVTKQCKWKVNYSYENDPRTRTQFFPTKREAKRVRKALLKQPVVVWAEVSR